MIVVSNGFLFWGAFVLSELMFLSLFFVYLGGLVRFEPRFRDAVGMGLLTAIAILTRYAAIFLVPLFVVALYLKHWPERRRCTPVALAFCSTSMLPWFVYRIFTRSRGSIAFHPIDRWHLDEAMRTIAQWYLPHRLNGAAIGAAITVGLACVLIVVLRQAFQQRDWDTIILGAGLAGYVAFLALCITFLGYEIILNTRLMLPAYILNILMLMRSVSQTNGAQLARLATISFLAPILITSTIRFPQLCTKLSHEGCGLTSRRWQESTSLAFVRRHGDGHLLYSNKPEALSFILNRDCVISPKRVNSWTNEANAHKTAHLQKMRESLEREHGWLIWFREDDRFQLVPLAELKKKLALTEVARTTDGVILTGGESLQRADSDKPVNGNNVSPVR